MRPYPPLIAGKIVQNREMSHRVLADFRKTIGACRAENHYGVMAELAWTKGLFTHWKASGPPVEPLDGLKNLGRRGWLRSEFWVPSPRRPTEEDRFFLKAAGSATHIYGRPVACGEGFASIGLH